MVKVSLLAAAAVLGMSLPAHADTPSTYVAANLTGGAEAAADWITAGVGVEGGFRLGDTLWARGRIAAAARVGSGDTSDISLDAPVREHVDALVGLETRRCLSPAACIIAGADAGVRSPDSKLGVGFEVVPRAGLDLGNDRLRFRPVVEANVAWISGFDTELGGVIPSLGIGVSLGVAYLW